MNNATSLASSFITVYPARGGGKIHSVDCTRTHRGQIRPTSTGAIRNGLAEVAACCKSHESHLFALHHYEEVQAGR